MKKLINDPNDFIEESLEGFALAHPHLAFSEMPRYITRKAVENDKVAIVSGGGSGHEPLHLGYVGHGMLDGACPGEVFSAPTPDQIYECAKAVNAGKGILFVVKNYTGDVLSFETAVELLHAEGIPVVNVLVDDDVSQEHNSHIVIGRRGMGTTIVVEKILGAAARKGSGLDQLVDLAHQIVSNGWSVGLALTSCTVPHKGSPTFELGDNQVEVGIGIHGERGQRAIDHKPADELVEMLAARIFDSETYTRRVREWNRNIGAWVEVELVNQNLKDGDRVIAIVNGMGGTPQSELYVVYRKLAQLCQEKGILIERNLVGSYITSLDMQGCSITMVRVNDHLLELWDAPVNTTILRWGM
ncbi:MAG: dihydroxyacetone kinase subunit DhaK [Chloroflexota bacterium]